MAECARQTTTAIQINDWFMVSVPYTK